MACSKCDGTGWVAVERDGVRRVERCVCWSERVTSQLLHDARIPPQYARCTLQSFVIYENPLLVSAVSQARKFVDLFPAVKKGICFAGPLGIGKTHLAVSVLRQLVQEKQIRGLYYDTRDLLRVIRSTYNPVVRTAEIDILRPVMKAELLVLDDLGAEKPSEWVEETINLILNTRYNERRITIITTNYDVADDVGDNLDSLIVRVGARLYSRLHEMCEFVVYDGGDYRTTHVSGPEADDLLTHWNRKKAKSKRVLPRRALGQARAQINEPREPKELKWPGGKAGRG